MDTLDKIAPPHRWTNSYYRVTIAAGLCVSLFSAYQLPLANLDVHFLLLALLTLAVSGRLTIRIPGLSGHISASDTLIFIALLLFGGEAAVLLAAADAFCASLRFSRKPYTLLFNAGAVACSTFLTVCVMRIAFGSMTELTYEAFAVRFLVGIGAMGLLQFVFSSGIVGVLAALKTNQPFWLTYKTYCLWSSVSYFGGVAAAGIIAKLIVVFSFNALLIAIPVIGILYFTYVTYLKNMETVAAQAAQAGRHVAELSSHIAEQARISSELEQSREHFRTASLHDALTSLPNRSFLKEKLRVAIEAAREDDKSFFAVLFLDLDRFKNINDSLGHAAGDRLLMEIAARLTEQVRPTDTVARLGGDEFAILLEGLRDWEEATNVAERILKDVMRPYNLNNHQLYTTISIGVALSAIPYDYPEEMLRDADVAMYRAKASGKACYTVFDHEMHEQAVALLQLENDLRRAVERQEFVVYYQPIVALDTDEISGFEALIRWQHPERGFISPAEFIPLAEETGLIIEIGDWVLRESCRQLREWQDQLPAAHNLTMSVNLSCKQFTQPDLVEQVRRILWETKLSASALKLEITESSVMVNVGDAAKMLEQLRALGVKLSIDDFGTGYSCLSHLYRFPATTLKIDRSFVSRLNEGHENLAIVRTIKTLADNLGMDTTAEGIETEEQLVQLRELGCQYGQGYLLGKPAAATTAFGLIKALQLNRAASPYNANNVVVAQFNRQRVSAA